MSKKVHTCKVIILTTQANYDSIKNYFKDNQFFGGNPANFIFYPQGQFPMVDLDGKIIMKKTYELQICPNSANGQAAIFEGIANYNKIRQAIR